MVTPGKFVASQNDSLRIMTTFECTTEPVFDELSDAYDFSVNAAVSAEYATGFRIQTFPRLVKKPQTKPFVS